MNNHRKLENLAVVLLIVIYIILSEGINIRSIILDIPFLAIGFYLCYLIVLFGLKIFKIRGISGNKIAIYILSVSILGLVYGSMNSIAEVLLNNVIILSIADDIIYYFFTLMFFRYYFLLSARQTLQLFLYLTLLWIIFSELIKYLLFKI